MRSFSFCVSQPLISISTSRLHHLYRFLYAFFIIPDLAYINRDFYAYNPVKSRLTYSFSRLDIKSLHIKELCYLINNLFFIDNDI